MRICCITTNSKRCAKLKCLHAISTLHETAPCSWLLFSQAARLEGHVRDLFSARREQHKRFFLIWKLSRVFINGTRLSNDWNKQTADRKVCRSLLSTLFHRVCQKKSEEKSIFKRIFIFQQTYLPECKLFQSQFWPGETAKIEVHCIFYHKKCFSPLWRSPLSHRQRSSIE